MGANLPVQACRFKLRIFANSCHNSRDDSLYTTGSDLRQIRVYRGRRSPQRTLSKKTTKKDLKRGRPNPSCVSVKTMKHARVSPFLASSLPFLACVLTLLSASAVSAAECPASPPDRTNERRVLAKEWCARAEAAESAGNDVEAVRAYACSMRMMAQASTVYSLARVAQRSGDVELALQSYRAYLTLKPDASERNEVQAKIRDLEAKIKGVQEIGVGKEPPTKQPPAVEAKPEVPVAPRNPVKVVVPELTPQLTRQGGKGRFPWQKDPGPIAGRWFAMCEEKAGMAIEFSVDGKRATGQVSSLGTAGIFGYSIGEQVFRLEAADNGDWVGQLHWRGVGNRERWDPIRFVATYWQLDATMTTDNCYKKMPRAR